MQQLIIMLLFLAAVPAGLVSIYNLYWDLRFWQKANYSWQRIWHHLWWDFELSHRDNFKTLAKLLLAASLAITLLVGWWELCAVLCVLYFAFMVNDAVSCLQLLLANRWPKLNQSYTARAVIYLHIGTLLVLYALIGWWFSAQRVIITNFSNDSTLFMLLPGIVLTLMTAAILDLGSSWFTILWMAIITPFRGLGASLVIRAAHRKLAQFPNLKVIFIAGSQGKTAVRKLLQNVLIDDFRISVVTTPAASATELARQAVSAVNSRTQVLIVEANSYALNDIRKLAAVIAPDIGVLTGISESYIGLYGSLDQTLMAHGELLEVIKPGGTAVLNGGDEDIRRLIQTHSNKEIIYYPYPDIAPIIDNDLELTHLQVTQLANMAGPKTKLEIATPSTKHYLEIQDRVVDFVPSILAAAAVALELGLALDYTMPKLGLYANILFPWHELSGDLNTQILIHEGHSNYSNLTQSLERMQTYAANKRILVIGGLKGFGGYKPRTYKSLAKQVQANIDTLITYDALLAAAVSNNNTHTEVVLVRTLNQLIYQLRKRMETGDLILIHGDHEPSLVAELRSN
jgi:UDP-N-acetylmuramoyl-tripeptide--D-alanyl-D-alanine ligase